MFFNSKKKDFFEAPVQPEAPVIDEPEDVQPVIEAPRSTEFEPAAKTVIGKGLVFHGNFTGEDPIVINGTIEGDITTSDKLTVSTGGSYYGNARVENLESNGTIEGSMICANHSVMGEQSVMTGKLTTRFMETKQGSVFSGSLTMNGDGNAAAAAPAEVPQVPVIEEPIKVPEFLDFDKEEDK